MRTRGRVLVKKNNADNEVVLLMKPKKMPKDKPLYVAIKIIKKWNKIEQG